MTDKPLILVVEDELAMAEHIAKTVKETERYEVVVAHNGVEAFKALDKNKSWLGFAENKIKCIILDLKMPEMDGLQFIKKFRREEPFYKLMPIIVLTGYEDEEKWIVTTSPRIGKAVAYLRKPFTREDLTDKIDRALQGEIGHMIDETCEKRHIKLEELREADKKKQNESKEGEK